MKGPKELKGAKVLAEGAIGTEGAKVVIEDGKGIEGARVVTGVAKGTEGAKVLTKGTEGAKVLTKTGVCKAQTKIYIYIFLIHVGGTKVITDGAKKN